MRPGIQKSNNNTHIVPMKSKGKKVGFFFFFNPRNKLQVNSYQQLIMNMKEPKILICKKPPKTISTFHHVQHISCCSFSFLQFLQGHYNKNNPIQLNPLIICQQRGKENQKKIYIFTKKSWGMFSLYKNIYRFQSSTIIPLQMDAEQLKS